MAIRLNPYLNFEGQTRAAMEFYQQALGGELTISTFGEFGNQDNPDGVMHAWLQTPDGFSLMASDMPPGMPHQAGNDHAVSISGDDAEKLRGFWATLSEGAKIEMPLEKQLWGDEFGSCTDKFGTVWMVNITAG